MSDRNISRVNVLHPEPVATGADLMDLITADLQLGARKKEARRTAIRTLCRGLKREAANVMLPDLRGAIETLAPADCGVSHRTFENIKAYARQALAPYRKGRITTRGIAMSPAWATLFKETGDANLLKSCGRFARWATVKGIAPAIIDQAIADKYAADLGVSLDTRNARVAFTRFCRGWNAAVATYETWPRVTLDRGDRRAIYALAASKVDANFLADLERMLLAFSSKLKLPAGMDTPFEPSTIRELRRIYLRLYTVAAAHLQPAIKVTSLSDLVKIEAAERILAFYLDRFGEENSKSANQYAHFLYIVAKYWVRAPDADVDELRRFRRVTKLKHKGMTEKNRAIVRRFDDDESAYRLLSQGAKCLAKFLKIERPGVRDALHLQDALAVELLIAAPVRPQNLCSISIDRHLVRQQIGKRETYHLKFTEAEVKNDIDLEFKLPQRVVAILKVYIAKAIPLLAEAGNPHLFPGRALRHKGPSGLSKQLARWTLKAIGVRITGHRFRHVVGFLYLKDNPTGHEVVRRFLGHKRIETTLAFYAGMEQAAAIALYDRHIETLRKRLIEARPKSGKNRAVSARLFSQKRNSHSGS